MRRVPVLIVGGGPVGLGAAISLARQGVASVLVERRPSTTDHPKARAVNVRTMELLRQWGVEEDLARYKLPRDYWRFIWCTTMAGREIARVSNPDGEGSQMSPTLREIVAQDAVEQVLYRCAESLPPASLRFSTECLSCSQTAAGVAAEVQCLETGRAETIEARYLIAADGATSGVRRSLGIAMEGPDALSHQASIYFRADLTAYSAHRPADIYYCTDGIWIAVVDGSTRWLGIMRYDPESMRREDFTPQFCTERIRRSVGVTDLPVEVINTSFWKMGAQVAARFRDGRIFLAGDAAHRMSPTGGFGLNTGVQDAHNLSWKLAAVLGGLADDGLLDTYEAERRPVGDSNARWSAENARRIWAIDSLVQEGDLEGVARGAEDQRKHICSEGRALGFRYASSAVVADEAEPPPAFSSRTYVPSAFPGCRAPHVWLTREGARCSTIDLFERRLVLLHPAPGGAWRAAAEILEPALRTCLEVLAIGPEGDLQDPGGTWRTLYGLEAGGAVLVRPDGHVAWRCGDGVPDPGVALAEVLGRILRPIGAATGARSLAVRSSS